MNLERKDIIKKKEEDCVHLYLDTAATHFHNPDAVLVFCRNSLPLFFCCYSELNNLERRCKVFCAEIIVIITYYWNPALFNFVSELVNNTKRLGYGGDTTEEFIGAELEALQFVPERIE